MSPELGIVKLASPCPEKWAAMEGDDRVRFCDRCALNVYNLSGLDADAARALLQQHEGRRLCVRFYQRKDGKVLTRDCTYGALLRSRWNQRIARGGFVALLLLAVLFLADRLDRHVKNQLSTLMGDSLAGPAAPAQPAQPAPPPPTRLQRPMRRCDVDL